MRLTVYGTRASYPVCRPGYTYYGGNTTCFLLEDGGERIIIDGGTGLFPLGRQLVSEARPAEQLRVFLTHPHWDHVMGFPLFLPAYDSRFHIAIYGADSENKQLDQIFANQHRAGNFPVSFEKLNASLNFRRIVSGASIEAGAVSVRCLQLNHPGVDMGYRFTSRGNTGSIVILTDLAPIEGNHLGDGMAQAADGRARQFEQDYVSALVEFVAGADLVIYDTNFTEDEIVGKRHWGHSTPQEAMRILSHLDDPPALVLSHHDPGHDDATMDAIYEASRLEGKARGIEVFIAREGGVFEL